MRIRGEDGKIAHVIHPTVGPCCVLEKELYKFPGVVRQKLTEITIEGASYFFPPSTRYQAITCEDGSIAFDGGVFDTKELEHDYPLQR